MRLGRRAFVGGALALASVGCVATGPAPIVGRPAPDFKLGSVDGGQLALSGLQGRAGGVHFFAALCGLQGRPVVVNFFATWCVPCKKELPAFQALSSQHADRGLTFLLVDMQE